MVHGILLFWFYSKLLIDIFNKDLCQNCGNRNSKLTGLVSFQNKVLDEKRDYLRNCRRRNRKFSSKLNLTSVPTQRGILRVRKPLPFPGFPIFISVSRIFISATNNESRECIVRQTYCNFCNRFDGFYQVIYVVKVINTISSRV